MNLWTLFKRVTKETIEMDASTILHKLEEVYQQIETQRGIVADLEARTRTALADSLLDGNGGNLDTLRQELRDAKDKLAELESVVPILCDRLQDARQATRTAKIEAYSVAIDQAGGQQEAIRRQLAALDAERRELVARFEAADSQVRDAVNERSRLHQRSDGWTGTLTNLAALASDPDAAPRPDELMRVLADLRDQEQREGSRVGGVEISFETVSGRITSVRPFNVQSRQELKDLELFRREREAQAKLQAASTAP